MLCILFNVTYFCLSVCTQAQELVAYREASAGERRQLSDADWPLRDPWWYRLRRRNDNLLERLPDWISIISPAMPLQDLRRTSPGTCLLVRQTCRPWTWLTVSAPPRYTRAAAPPARRSAAAVTNVHYTVPLAYRSVLGEHGFWTLELFLDSPSDILARSDHVRHVESQLLVPALGRIDSQACRREIRPILPVART